MTIRTFFILLLVVLIGMGLAFWLWPREQKSVAPSITRQAIPAPPPVATPAPETQATNQVPPVDIPNIPGHPLTPQDKQNISQIYWMTHIPISFYGKVIDQNKEPVVDADITYSAADRYFASGDKYKGSSDENGLFSITGIYGMGVSVEVKKDGYYQLGEKSMRGFHAGSNEMPTQNNPAIFELRKKGLTEHLIVSGAGSSLQRDGTPVQVDLINGRTFHVTNGDLQVQAWINDKADSPDSPEARVHYDWRCKITMLGGGIQPRTGGEFDFVAPTDDYQPSAEIVMPANADRWQFWVKQSYFIKLANGDYGRIDCSMSAGRVYEAHAFGITAYINPTPGHTNLEYDPKQKANP